MSMLGIPSKRNFGMLPHEVYLFPPSPWTNTARFSLRELGLQWTISDSSFARRLDSIGIKESSRITRKLASIPVAILRAAGFWRGYDCTQPQDHRPTKRLARLGVVASKGCLRQMLPGIARKDVLPRTLYGLITTCRSAAQHSSCTRLTR